MSRLRILVTRRLPDDVQTALEESFEADLHDSDEPPSREDVLVRLAGRDGFLAMLTDRIDGELLDAAGPQLRVVANYAVGYDNVDLQAAADRGVVVSTTPDVLTGATAELALTLMLSLARRVTEGDRMIRRAQAWVWSPTFMLGSDLMGRTVGCVGYGRIGQAFGRLAEALGMRVIWSSRGGGVPLERLLEESDVVSLHCPLTPETHHLIDRAALARMRPHALLVNTARGAVVDEAALAAALAAGRIGGAALDVYEAEPHVAEELLGLENVVLAPHLGSATAGVRRAMGMLCADALRAVLLEGRAPPNALNPESLRSAAQPLGDVPTEVVNG